MNRPAWAHDMMSAFNIPAVPLLVFTDLDGTLLDHDGYDYAPAHPALARLAALRVPLIPTTSKTLAEVSVLQAELGNHHPCIVENGGALCLPPGYFGDQADGPVLDGYLVEPLVPGYGELLATLHEIRRAGGYRFTGFRDMSDDEVARDSGLSLTAAARARRRLCSEPLRWEDDEAALADFARRLDDAGLTLTQGGRYLHVMGRTSKGRALRRLCERYRDAGFNTFTTVALGDSPNDKEMLEAADIAVIVRREDGGCLDAEGRYQTITTNAAGPTGWNSAITQLLHNLAPDPGA